jgi:hypothetical protein
LVAIAAAAAAANVLLCWILPFIILDILFTLAELIRFFYTFTEICLLHLPFLRLTWLILNFYCSNGLGK